MNQPDTLNLDEQALRAKRLRAFTALELGLPLRSRGELEPEILSVEVIPLTQRASPLRRDTKPTPVQLAPKDDPREDRAMVSFESLDSLEQQVAGCQACGLCKSRTQTVFSAGNPAAPLAIVGEAPGAEEDRTGQAFVGQAGKLLDGMLMSLGLNRAQDAYICNVLKCRPPNNRDPSADEVAKCEPYLQNQLNLVQPEIILVVGRFAAQSLLRTEASIASLRGKLHSYSVAGRDIPVVVTYHPAYLLRNLGDKAKTWADLCFLKSQMTQLPQQ